MKDVGAWRYAEDFTTEILCLSYKFDDGKTGLWIPGIDFPQVIINHVEAGGIFESHNAQFERAIWMLILRPQFGVPMPVRWRDTMAVCAYRALPLKLDKAGEALNLRIQKDKRGTYLLNTLTTPKFGTKNDPDRIYREDWDLMDELYTYCMQDSDSEYELSQTLGPLPPPEYNLWCLDQRINQRGVLIDIEAVEAALEVIDRVATKLNGELRVITEGAVQKGTQRDKLLHWFRANGLPQMANLQKETIEDLLLKDKEGEYLIVQNPDVTPGLLRALVIRSQIARASTKKLQKALLTVSRDARIRGMLQYHGAGTGRWAGRGVQPQNFPRAIITNCQNEDGTKKWLDMELLVQHIKEDSLDEHYASAMDAVASMLRGMFIAAPGKVFHICDFSAVEARVTFWVANCLPGLDMFAKSDSGESEDIYCVTASDLVGFTVTKKDNHERQLGKITVLGCGYQMGWEKLQYQAAKDYKVVLEDAEAQGMVNLYRDKYAEVKWLWYGLNDAAIAAVKTGMPHSYNNIIYDVVEDAAGRWLTCILPNGRKLWYYEPVVEKSPTPWGEMKDSLTYSGRDNKRGGAWGRVRTYGGMLTENVVQAIARDLMAEAMIRVELAGYAIVMTIHDEIISEDDKDFGSQEDFDRIMCITPPWAIGCPIAVEGGTVTRYQKI